MVADHDRILFVHLADVLLEYPEADMARAFGRRRCGTPYGVLELRIRHTVSPGL